jgi:hypothetical protein
VIQWFDVQGNWLKCTQNGLPLEVLKSGTHLDYFFSSTCVQKSTYSGIRRSGDLWFSVEKSLEVPKS